MGYLIGYFLFMIILTVAAILLAKKKGLAWTLWGAGVALQLMSMLGNQRKYSYYGMSTPPIYWIVFLVIAIVGAVVVYNRGKDK